MRTIFNMSSINSLVFGLACAVSLLCLSVSRLCVCLSWMVTQHEKEGMPRPWASFCYCCLLLLHLLRISSAESYFHLQLYFILYTQSPPQPLSFAYFFLEASWAWALISSFYCSFCAIGILMESNRNGSRHIWQSTWTIQSTHLQTRLAILNSDSIWIKSNLYFYLSCLSAISNAHFWSMLLVSCSIEFLMESNWNVSAHLLAIIIII